MTQSVYPPTEPIFRSLQDQMVKYWMAFKYLSARDFKFGWLEIKTGRTRCGKTETNILEACLLSRKGFDSNMIAWKPKQYHQTLEDVKPGEPIVWTELGRGMNARQWQKLSNIITNETLQIMMIKRPIVFMDVIDLSFVDVQIRKMARVYCETFRPPWENVYVRPFFIQTHYRTGDIFYPYPRVKTPSGQMKLSKITVKTRLKEVAPRIYDDFLQVEEREKNAAMKKGKAEIDALTREIGEESIIDYANTVLKDPLLYKNPRGNWSMELIRARMGMRETTAKQVKVFLESEDHVARLKRVEERLTKT